MHALTNLMVFLVLVVSPALLEANPDKLHGKWEVESTILHGKKQLPENDATIIMEFDKEKMTHTMTVITQDKIETSEYTWKIEGNKISLISAKSRSKNTMIIKLEGDECTMSSPDGVMVLNLKRIKSE